jgi:hypothetical protein
MGARVLVGMSLVAGVVGTLAFVACGEAFQPHAPRGASSATPSTAGSTSPSASEPVSASASPQDASEAIEPRACDDPRVEILNHPDGGVVFNNAMTSADAGFIDRTEPSIRALAAKASEFRCCLAKWVGTHEGEQRLMVVVQLAPDGTVSESRIDASRSDVDDPATLRCVELVAREASFPASPSGKDTWLEYPLRVRATGGETK